MAIPFLTEDLAYISKLGDDPVREGLTTQEFRAEFDKAAGRVKDFLNETIIPAVNAINAGAVVMSTERPTFYPVLWFEIPAPSDPGDPEPQSAAGYVHKSRIVYIDAFGSDHLLLPETEQTTFRFLDTSVPVNAFVTNTDPDTLSAGFAYMASVPLEGALSSMAPDIRFSALDATEGNYSPTATPYDGGIYIYASAPPVSALVIPTIILERGNA